MTVNSIPTNAKVGSCSMFSRWRRKYGTTRRRAERGAAARLINFREAHGKGVAQLRNAVKDARGSYEKLTCRAAGETIALAALEAKLAHTQRALAKYYTANRAYLTAVASTETLACDNPRITDELIPLLA
jgi:hypothetical protein